MFGGGGMSNGAKLAAGIVLLWLGGSLLFIAFMSGKVGSLTTGKSKDGKAQGPRDASELVVRLSQNVQAAASSAPASSSTSGSGGTSGNEGGLVA